MAFIRRVNNGIVPIGLTRTSAAAMISSHLSRVVAESKAQQVDISPLEFMSGSKSYREKAKLERDRKRAQEKVAKQQEQERRLREREAQKAQKAADRLYDRRMAEEEKLFKVREEAHDGISHKVRNAKAQAIYEGAIDCLITLRDRRIT